MTVFEKIQPITVYDAVLYAKLQSIVNFLPQASFIAAGDGELFIDDQACYCLPVSIADEMCFRLVQFESHLTKHSFHLFVDAIERTVCRKGHIIAIASIGDLALVTPATDLVIKTTHDDIGERRRCWRALWKSIIFATQGSQQKADLLRYIAGVESCAEDLLKRDASEKIGNIQL